MKAKKSSAKKSAAPVSFDNPTARRDIVPTSPSPVEPGYLEGDWGAGDLKIARLDLKHVVDTRFADVTPGHYVYSRSPEDYFPLIPPFPVTILKARKGYLRDVDPGETALVCYTKADLAELGGTTDTNRPDLTLFNAFCDTLLLINRSAHPEWPGTLLLDVGGTKMALATYRAKKSAFSEFGSVLANWEAYQRMSKQKPAPLWEQVWKLGSTLRKLPSFSYQIPTLEKLNAVTPAESKALRELAENL
jgi:hypothetical protein